MKSSISISNWIADVVVIIFPVGNVTVRGVIVYTVAGSCAANLWLTNDRIAPMSSMAGTANPWVYTDRYKRPHCICMLLSNGLSTFPAYLMSAGCISFPAPSHCLCPYYWTLLFYYWVLASSWVFFYCAGAFVIFLDSTWRYVPFFRNYSTSVLWLACALYIIHLSSCWKFPEGLEWSLCLKSVLYVFFQLQRDCHDFV